MTAVWILCGVLAAVTASLIYGTCKLRAWNDKRDHDALLRYGDRLIRQLNAEAERLYPDTPPCSHEDGWCVCVPEPWDSRWAR